MEHVIEVKNLTKTYKKAKEPAVDNISFYVEKGSFFSLLGPNGAGKTTTISILTTTLSKTAGEITINGYQVGKEDSKVRENIGVIFQNPSLDQNLTAEENIRFHANLYNLYPYAPLYSMMPQEYKDKVNMLAEIIGLREAIKKPVKSLSGGMKRKLEIIRSLMHKPNVLFLDEPTQGLDPLSRRNLWDYLKDIREKENVTIFLTTHYLEEAEHADYITILNKGRIVSKGTPKEIKDSLIQEYIVMDAKDREALQQELSSKNISFTGKGPFNIDTKDSNAQKIIQSVTSPLSLLKIHNPSLEEAYVEIIKKDE